jgi:FecR protein
MRFTRVLLCTVLVGQCFGLAIAFPSPAAAALYAPQQALPAKTVHDFIASPGTLLAQYPGGGPEMISRVRDLAASNPATLNVIVGLLGSANHEQSIAIGTGLGQAAIMAVKTDQAYATQIQEALGAAASSRNGVNEHSANDVVSGSVQPKIGDAVTTKNQVNGVTEKGTQSVTTGSSVYQNEIVRTGVAGKAELLFADRTNLTVAPVTEIRLDKFVYDPSSGSGVVHLVANSGAFRFITGIQPHQNYEIKTPFATMGVRGTQFIVQISPDSVQIQLISGEVVVTTISGKVVTLSDPGTVLTITSQGDTQGPVPVDHTLVDFADLGDPVTNVSLADALSAFGAVTGNIATGAVGGGGGGGGGGDGGGGGSITAFGGGGGGGSSGAATGFNTFAITTPTNFFSLSFIGSPSTPGTPSTSAGTSGSSGSSGASGATTTSTIATTAATSTSQH